MQDKVQSIASTAALDINTEGFTALQTADDYKKARVGKNCESVNKHTLHNEHIFYVYIIRKSPANPYQLQFQADADSLNPVANTDNDPSNNVDLNSDGKLMNMIP